MKIKFLDILKYLLFLSLAGFLLYWAFRGQDFNQLVLNLQNAHYGWMLASVMACLFAHLLRAIRWQMLIQPLGFQPPIKNTFYAVMVGYLANLAFPRMGEVSRCGVLAKTDKIPMNQLLGTVITERLSDLLMLLSITALAILLAFERISGFIYQNGWLKIQGAFAEAIIWWTISALLFLFLLFYFLRSKIKNILQPFTKTLEGLKNGLFSFKKMPDKTRFIFLSLLIWLFYFLSTYWCFFALGATTHLGLSAALATLVFGSLGMIVPVQGGIGAFHWMVAEGLTLYAIPKSDGLSFATLLHSSQILLILMLGAFSLVMVIGNSSGTKKIN